MLHYTGKTLSPRKWRAMGGLSISFTEKETTKTSNQFTFDQLEAHIESTSSFDSKQFGLPAPVCSWLDGSVGVKSAFHFTDGSGESVKFELSTSRGSAFPLKPLLDREGHAYSSVQLATLDRVFQLRRELVEKSDAHDTDEWLWLLKSLVFETTSLLDTTLHQLYYKVVHDPLPAWKGTQASLDKAAPLKGGRLRNKFQWVYAACQRHPCLTNEMRAFNRIRHLRNHMQHWDPPCLCFTLEDAAGWLNDVLLCARMNWNIRVAVGSPPSAPLIALLLAPEVAFVARHPNATRIPQPSDTGYASVIWSYDRSDSGY
jgi:hypothetical protein